MATSVNELKEGALAALSSKAGTWLSTDCIVIAIDDAAGEPVDWTEIDAALDALVAEGKAERATIHSVALYRASRQLVAAGTNRWHNALERAATDWDKSVFQSGPDTARKVRSALAVGVRTEHEALLVLAALGFETPEGINAVLGGARDGT